jgi:hypothetical protein
MDIATLTTIELEALGYKEMMKRSAADANLQMIQAELSVRYQKPPEQAPAPADPNAPQDVPVEGDPAFTGSDAAPVALDVQPTTDKPADAAPALPEVTEPDADPKTT